MGRLDIVHCIDGITPFSRPGYRGSEYINERYRSTPSPLSSRSSHPRIQSSLDAQSNTTPTTNPKHNHHRLPALDQQRLPRIPNPNDARTRRHLASSPPTSQDQQ